MWSRIPFTFDSCVCEYVWMCSRVCVCDSMCECECACKCTWRHKKGSREIQAGLLIVAPSREETVRGHLKEKMAFMVYSKVYTQKNIVFNCIENCCMHMYILLTDFIFQSSSRFAAQLGRRYREFSYTCTPHPPSLSHYQRLAPDQYSCDSWWTHSDAS